MDGDVAPMLARSPDLGRAKRIDDVQARYIEYAKRTLGREVSFEGLRVVVDCANGAAYKVAPGGAVGTRRRGDPDRRRAERTQHQSRRRLDRARGAGAQSARNAGRRRHRARRRRRPDDHRRREGPRRRRRPGDGCHRRELAGRRPAGQARRRRDRDVQPRARAVSRASGLHARANGGRRPLCDRADARKRLQRRRRAVGPRHLFRLLDHRRRPGFGVAGACGGAEDRQAGQRGLPSLRSVAAGAAQRPLQRRQAAGESGWSPRQSPRRPRGSQAAAGWSSARRAPSRSSG